MISGFGWKPLRNAVWATSLLGVSLASPSLRADQSSLNIGLVNFGGSASNALNSGTGYAVNFVSQSSGNFIRPSIGVQLETSSGTLADNTSISILSGALMGGAHFFFFKTARVRPFLTTEAMAGWGSMTYGGDQSTIGINYGIVIGGGTELRFKDDPKGKALRLTTSYRWYQSSFTVGSLTGFDYSGILFGVGFSF